MLRLLVLFLSLLGLSATAAEPKKPTARSLGIDKASVKKDLATVGDTGCDDLAALVQTLCLTKLKAGCDLDYLQYQTVLGVDDPKVSQQTCGVMAKRLKKKVDTLPDFTGTLPAACGALKADIEGAHCFTAPQRACKDALRALVSANEIQCGMAKQMVKFAPQP